MNLSLLIILPLITAVAILLAKGLKQVRVIAFIGASAAIDSCALPYYISISRKESTAIRRNFLFEDELCLVSRHWNINFHLGVDGISVAMILLTAFVVIAGVLVSWKMEKMNKEFFFLLILLSLGAYGFFISLDLFTLFFFLEIAVIPKFLLIGIWGSGKKEYSANETGIDADGWICIGICWISWAYILIQCQRCT